MKIHVLAALLFLMAGCAGQSPTDKHYYWLNSGLVSESGVVANFEVKINLASYLRQPGIVLAKQEHELQLANYHLWAEPLNRAIRSHLKYRLEDAQLKDVDWVQIDIRQLHGSVQGQVLLDAKWHVMMNCKLEAQASFNQTLAQPQAGYRALVSSHQELLRQLSQSIAKALPSC